MLAVALLVALPGVGGHALDLEGELTEILALLPGRYRGVAPDPRDPEAPAQPLFHKIVRIDAPQFGSDAVYYHVIAREGYDSVTPFQQKIYAFDRSAGRAGNAMRSWVYLPTTPGTNLDQDPARQRSLQREELMSFPTPACAIRWSRRSPSGEYTARVQPADCVFPSAAFRQDLRPDMTYVLSPASFGIEDILNGEDGRPLFPSSGIVTATRETSR